MHSQMSVSSVCSSSYKNTNNSFFISGTYVHLFLDSTATFFLAWMETHFFGARPLNVAQGFFHLFYYFLDAFLKKRMAPSFWKTGKSKSTTGMADTLLLSLL